MLSFDVLNEGAPAGAPVFVLLHGRGADRRDLAGLREGLPANGVVVLPEAPFPGAAWGYGGGFAWYRFLGRNVPDPDSFAHSLSELDALIDTLRERFSGPVVLGGFSQGGTMSLGYALSHPGKAPLVWNFSGFLADHPAVVASPETVRGTEIFWGHGMQDANIPFALAVEGREALLGAGAQLTARDYPIGHWIDPKELGDAVAWYERRA